MPNTLFTAMLAFAVSTSARGDVLDAIFVDGLDRPLEGVRVDVVHDQSVVAHGETGPDGRLRLEFALSTREHAWVRYNKTGYSGSTNSGIHPRYEMARQTAPSFADIERMAPADRPIALRERLAADIHVEDGEDDDPFLHDDLLRPTLRALVEDPKVGRKAVDWLARVGDRADIDFVLAHRPAVVPDNEDFDNWQNHWAYSIATALIDPTTDAQWEFLEEAASGSYSELWVDWGAIKTLAYSADPRSRQILARVSVRNVERADEIAGLLKRGPLPQAALRAVSPHDGALALGCNASVGRYTGAEKEKTDQGGDKVSVPLSFRSGPDLLIYDAIYERMAEGDWRLRSFNEAGQILLTLDAPEPRDVESPCNSKAAGTGF
jgi:hypothetical protein